MTLITRTLIAIAILTSLLIGAAAVRAVPAPNRRNVEIEWEAIDGASAYEVRVTRKDGSGAPLTFKLKSSRWSANVKSGPYAMELRTFDARGVPGPWSPPTDIMVKVAALVTLHPTAAQIIVAKHADEETVDFAWESVASAREYRLEITGPRDFTRTLTSKTPRARTKLAVAAAYAWRVTAVDSRGQDGERAETAVPFTVRGPTLDSPRPEAPLSKYVDRIAWPTVTYAEVYETDLRLFNRRTKAWDPVPGPAQVTTSEYLIDPARPTGRYRLSVIATAANRGASRRTELTFALTGGFLDRDHLRDAELRDSLNKPGAIYAIAALVPGQVTYVARIADANSIVNFTATQLTARVGAGYQTRTSAWGGHALAEVAQTGIASATSTSSAAEAHVTYRWNLGRRGVVRLGGGAFYRQLPIVVGSPLYGFSSLGRVTQMGPHAGVGYAYPFSERWGLRADGKLYYAATGSSGAGATTATLAHEVQLLTTYRYAPRLTIIGGVGRRHDEASWSGTPGGQSFARPGDVNQLSSDTLNVTVGFEFGF